MEYSLIYLERGQGVVAEGKIDRQNKIFFAKRVLAKHDENYMPPEVKNTKLIRCYQN